MLEYSKIITYDDIEIKNNDDKKNISYCPAFFPYLCNINTHGSGLCRKSNNDCNKKKIGYINVYPIIYYN